MGAGYDGWDFWLRGCVGEEGGGWLCEEGVGRLGDGVTGWVEGVM